MEHDETQILMMEALDGELGENERTELHIHLQNCPSCAQEWETLQAIHQLFLQSPVLSPAADFTQRTLALLPNTRQRMYAMAAAYGMLLVIGLIPLAVIIWLALQFGPALNQPAFLRSLVQAASEVGALAQAVLGAFWQGIGNFGGVLGQQPAIVGWLLVLVGIIFLWGGVYSQLTARQRV